MNQDRQVVITGIGPVTAVGTGWEEFREGLIAGESGIREISTFDPGDTGRRLAAEIEEFDVEEFLETPKAYLDPSAELAFGAMSLALENSGIDPGSLPPGQVGLALGSAYGSIETTATFFQDLLDKGPRFVKPFLFPHTYSNTPAGLISIEYGLMGRHSNFASGAVSSILPMVEAFDRIRQGRESLCFVGGYESLGEILFKGAGQAGLLSPLDDGAEHCSPFGATRNGFILGEGAGIIVMEELSHAEARGAHVYARVAGAGIASDGRLGVDKCDDGSALASAMQLALQTSSVEAKDVDAVCASANGSVIMDYNEARAIEHVFGTGNPDLPVSTPKGSIGETLGACGVLQAAASVAWMAAGSISPIMGLQESEEGFNLNLVQEKAMQAVPDLVLLNAADPGGCVVSMVLERVATGGTTFLT
jgi:3-oxoacyl-[acyl-carrier-protein] synthase II